MKKVLLFLTFSLMLGTIYGQLSNCSFESWNTNSYDEPTGFQTGNHESSSLGLVPVTKVNGHSGFAVRMETLASNGDTAEAYIANGDPGKGDGGVPFSAQPTAITGFYRYHIPANDTAIFLVMFKKNGQLFSQDIFKIKGTGDQPNWVAFSFPLSLPMAPDSVIIAAASSNLIDKIGVEPGSFLEIDQIAFTGTASNIDNSQFENWSTHSDDAIIGWETYGQVAKVSDSYEGSSAISLTTVDYGNGNIGTSGITCGHNTNNNGPTGGVAFTEIIDTLVGYYKFSANGPDSAQVSVSTLNNSNYVGGSGRFLPPAAQYTYFEIPFSSNIAPDTLRVDCSSSKWPMSPSAVGSTLILDNLNLKSVIAAGTSDRTKKKQFAFTFPNPAKDFLHIHLENNSTDIVVLDIFDLSGRLILSEKKYVVDSNIDMNISSLKTGQYIYRVSGNKFKYEQIFTKE